ncbi:hypothetical protein [Halobacterium yunchengense]|uniref:hypothetical protein n=1 Tax=Halobacterium yunchengense TaxID=3108497 RepID=UPI0030091ED0
MGFEQTWRDLRERVRDRGGAVYRTPRSDRSFAVTDVAADRIDVTYVESGAARTLWRDQFELLADRLDDGDAVAFADLPPGVEPYVAVLSASDRYAVEDGALRRGDATGESPLVREREHPDATALRDDARLLAALLDRRDLASLPGLADGDVVDLYVALSDVQRGADDVRRTVGDELLDRIGPSGRLQGRFGTVSRAERERRRLRDESTVFDALDDHGIPREWVTGVDTDRLDVVLAVTDLDADEVYDVDTATYVQKTGVAETEKAAALSGLRDRLAATDGDEPDLRDELDDLEAAIDDRLGSE